MRRIRLRDAAQAELTRATERYEESRPGLGRQFLAEVDALLGRVAALPETFPLWRADRPFRRALLRRFPYVVFFVVEPDAVVVFAVAHAKRRPGYWTRR